MITLNGFEVLGGSITMPQSGVWVATVQLPLGGPEDGEVEFLDPFGQRLVGTVRDANPIGSRLEVMVNGGVGEARNESSPTHFKDGKSGAIMQQLATDYGGPLSNRITSALKGSVLPFWTNPAIPVAWNCETLSEALETRWGVDRDGALLFGYDPTEKSEEFDVLDANPGRKFYDVAPEGLFIVPGDTQQGQTVIAVDYYIQETLRVRYWL